MNEIINRMIKKYDELIEELTAIDNENRSKVPLANQDPDNPKVREWARLARENQRRLEFAKAERELLGSYLA